MRRTIIIGDLHGCHIEALELLDKCQATTSDRVIFLGDLIDRGADNDKCVDLSMKIEKEQGSKACILGNHENKHISYRDREERGQPITIISNEHVKTRAQLYKEHHDYFKTLPTFIRIPEHNVVCVHAGVWPNVKIEDQESRHLLHIQSIFNDPSDLSKKTKWPSKVLEHETQWKFWTNFWTGPETIVFGHSVLDTPLISEYAIGIDGGAVFGRELWAYVLPNKEIVRVKSKTKVYDNRSKLYEVAPGVHTY